MVTPPGRRFGSQSPPHKPTHTPAAKSASMATKASVPASHAKHNHPEYDDETLELIMRVEMGDAFIGRRPDSDEEEAFGEAGRPGLPGSEFRIKKGENDEETIVNVVEEKDGLKNAALNQNDLIKDEHTNEDRSNVRRSINGHKRKLEAEGDIKKESEELKRVKVKDEDDEKVKKEELDDAAQIPARRKDHRSDEETRRLRDARRNGRNPSTVPPDMDPIRAKEDKLAERIASLEGTVAPKMWEHPNNRHARKRFEIREWYLSSLLFKIVNEGHDLVSDPIDLEDWAIIAEDLKNLLRPLEKEEFGGLQRQINNIPTQGLSFAGREAQYCAKISLSLLTEPRNPSFVEDPTTDSEWDELDKFRDECKTESEFLTSDIKRVKEEQTKHIGRSVNVVDANGDFASQL